jgi:N-acetylglutamate synthase-like GNAT family acetyltransferase
MTTPALHARRATVEDLPQLRLLWEQEQLDAAILEKRFKEFQVVGYESGELLGAVGLEVAGQEGRLHSEAFARPEEADALREMLWRRVQIIARNVGLVRVWTQLAATFWQAEGFESVGENPPRLPLEFAGGAEAWFCAQVKSERGELNVEQELALLQAAERGRTEQLYRQARIWKGVALVIAIGVFLLAILWAVYFFKLQQQSPLR